MNSYTQQVSGWLSLFWFLENMHKLLSNIIFFVILYCIFNSTEEKSQDTLVSMFSRVILEGIDTPAPKQSVFFKDIIVDSRHQGIDEYRAEVEDIVDFLKHPDKYINAGAKMPKGVLFHGRLCLSKANPAQVRRSWLGLSRMRQAAASTIRVPPSSWTLLSVKECTN